MNASDLESLGYEVSNLFINGSYSELAGKYAYAMSYERPTIEALKEDYSKLANNQKPNIVSVSVKYFEPNSTGLAALVECYLSVENNNNILIELILSESGNIYIEDISNAA